MKRFTLSALFVVLTVAAFAQTASARTAGARQLSPSDPQFQGRPLTAVILHNRDVRNKN